MKMQKTREQKLEEKRIQRMRSNIYTDKNLFFTHIPKNGGRMLRLNIWSKITESGVRPIHAHPDHLNSFEEWKDVDNFVFVRIIKNHAFINCSSKQNLIFGSEIIETVTNSNEQQQKTETVQSPPQ